MPEAAIEPLEASIEELEGLVEQARSALSEEGHRKLGAAIRTLAHVTALLERQEATLAGLRKLLCRATTEKTSKVLEEAALSKNGTQGKVSQQPGNGDEQESGAKKKRKRVPGHGRNGVDAYPGAQRVVVDHASLKRGDACPLGCGGRLNPIREPKVLLRIRGQAPIAATKYELERLRCHSCGAVFTAEPPVGVGENKYQETAVSMIAVLRYGNGVPWNRLEALEAALGIPLAAGTQCGILLEFVVEIQCVWLELIRQAAQGQVVHNDDTGMRVLQLERDPEISAKRTGVFTSGIVSIAAGVRIALFFTGRKHAGENLAVVLRKRAAESQPPIQMCDGLDWNVPKPSATFRTLVANCNAHGRRQFVKVIENFPDECEYVLKTLGTVYHYDDRTKEQGLTDEERLRFHQEHSKPLMDKLHLWLLAQFAEKLVEPNSGLGKAISYLLKRWEKLTLFLRKPGSPLDNNIVERALKMAIRHRKNSLFYRTKKGAEMGDIFMSLIHTCELNGVNAFDYLTELQRHIQEVKQNPAAWMPWNYRQNLLAQAVPNPVTDRFIAASG